MNRLHVSPFFRASGLCALLLLMNVPVLRAQYETRVALNKKTYLTYESVEATVTVTNRSGADVVMGGPNGSAWLSFDITDPGQKPLPPMRFNSEENIVFKTGATISRTVNLGEQFTFTDYGAYGIIANVYHPPSQQFYRSNRAIAEFTDATPFWKPSFGVPPGLPGAGQIRRYELAIVRDVERTSLYFRLVEDKSNIKLATYSLGTCIMVIEPQVTLDKDNKMHVLFMAAPHIYAHVSIDTQGKLAKREYFKEIDTNRPRLAVDNTQNIAVQGGEPYDPAAPVVTRPAGRSIKQRPPGL
jgi:hypothetical protein